MRPEYGSPDDIRRQQLKADNVRRAIWGTTIIVVIGLLTFCVYMLIMADVNAKADFKKECESKGGYTVKSSTWTDCRDKDTGYIINQRGR